MSGSHESVGTRGKGCARGLESFDGEVVGVVGVKGNVTEGVFEKCNLWGGPCANPDVVGGADGAFRLGEVSDGVHAFVDGGVGGVLIHCGGEFAYDGGAGLVDEWVHAATDHVELRVIKSTESAGFRCGIGVFGSLDKLGTVEVPVIYKFTGLGGVCVGFGDAGVYLRCCMETEVGPFGGAVFELAGSVASVKVLLPLGMLNGAEGIA